MKDIIISTAEIRASARPPCTAIRGPRGHFARGPSGDVRKRPPHPAQRFVAPSGVPLKAPVATFACARLAPP
eukprot:3851907-Pyramimonas_sp.AAC.1